MTIKIKRSFNTMTWDPINDHRSAKDALGFEPACAVAVYLKGKMHSVALTALPGVHPEFVTEITDNHPNPLHRLAQLTVTAVDYIAGYRKGSKAVMRRVRDYLGPVVAGLVHHADSPFIYIEVGDVNPVTDHARLRFQPTNCETADELCDYLREALA
jgi:hypothetical protein